MTEKEWTQRKVAKRNVKYVESVSGREDINERERERTCGTAKVISL